MQRARPGDKLSHVYDIFIVAVAFLSIIPLMFRPQDAGPELTFVLNLVDVVTVYILFFDYIMRWATHDIKTGKKGWRTFVKYPFTPLAIIDLLAILPSLGVLPETFKFLRVLRVTKMFRYSKNLTIVGNVFRAEKNTLLSVLVVALMYIFVSGLIMFVNEPETFDNFFDALYWATTALTTVGYGDVYPTTDLGKFISMASSLFGIAVIALPAGIITGGFLEQIRQSQENRDAYYRVADRAPFKGRALSSYGSVSAYVKAHPKVVAYAVVMVGCFCLNELLYLVAVFFGTPVWLDTVGTAVAVILLEPAAGLIIAFANNLIQAIQFGDAGNLLYYCMGAMAALVYGTLFARDKKITARSLGWAALFLVGGGTLISCALTFSLSDGTLTTGMQYVYYDTLSAWGIPSVGAVIGALFIDKLVDATAVFVLAMLLSRSIIGSRIDPKRWFGTQKTDSSPTGAEKGSSENTPQDLPNDPSAARAAESESQEGTRSGKRHVLGLDVGGTHTKAGIFTEEGELVGSHVFNTRRVLDDGSHAQLSDEVHTLLQQTGVDASSVVGVGLAVPGMVSAEESLKMCPNLDLNLRSYKAFLRSVFPTARVAVMNDADAAVLGDRWRGTSHDRAEDSVVFVTLGTGVGSGVIVKGKLLSGVHGAAGELGHLCVDPHEEKPCSCGKTGCLEQYASATGLVRMAREEFAERALAAQQNAAGNDALAVAASTAAALAATGTPAQAASLVGAVAAGVGHDASDEEAQNAFRQAAEETFPDARAVIEAAARRDPSAKAALMKFSDALGFGLAQMACVLDPDVFILGGGLSERADLYLGDVQARYRACAITVCRDTPIVASALGNECGVYGAARRVLDVLSESE